MAFRPISLIPLAVRQRIAGGICRALTGAVPAAQGAHVIDRDAGRLHFQSVRVEQSGLVKLAALLQTDPIPDRSSPRCLIDEVEIPLVQAFRTVNAARRREKAPESLLRGMMFVYRIPDRLPPRLANLTIVSGVKTVFQRRVPVQAAPAHYEPLLTADDVLHRDHIYGSGPPSKVVSREIAALAQTLEGPVLDFGCGSGALIRKLRSQGIHAQGIELERDVISNSLDPSIKDLVTLYDGKPPLPFADEQFRSVIAIEVIEHIEQLEPLLGELSRITGDRCLVTVPDISSIPMCFLQNVVPWHILEETHVNFFTPDSLRNLLKKYFSTVLMGKICPSQTNDALWHESLLAVCRKK